MEICDNHTTSYKWHTVWFKLKIVHLKEVPDRGALSVRLRPQEKDERFGELWEVLRLPLRRQKVRGNEEDGSRVACVTQQFLKGSATKNVNVTLTNRLNITSTNTQVKMRSHLVRRWQQTPWSCGLSRSVLWPVGRHRRRGASPDPPWIQTQSFYFNTHRLLKCWLTWQFAPWSPWRPPKDLSWASFAGHLQRSSDVQTYFKFDAHLIMMETGKYARTSVIIQMWKLYVLYWKNPYQ